MASFDYTLKGTNSTSYVPLDSYLVGTHTANGANDYFTYHIKYDKWNNLTEAEKQRALVLATNRLDKETFGGRKTITDQRLQWPRLWIVDRNYEQDQDSLEFTGGNYFQEPDYLPKEIEDATFELALYYVEEFILEEPLFSRQDQERMANVKIGPISAELRKAKEDILPDSVIRLLKAAGPNAWQGNRGIRTIR